MLKFLLILFLFLLLAGYVGFRLLRFLTRIAQTVSGIHEEGQRNPRSGYGRPPEFDRAGRGAPSGEKDITGRARIIPPEAPESFKEKPGRDA